MKPHKTTLERAFELAKSGKIFSLAELRMQLANEGYYTDVLEGPILMGQLRSAIEEASGLSLTPRPPAVSSQGDQT